jgi:hypothetical protein
MMPPLSRFEGTGVSRGEQWNAQSLLRERSKGSPERRKTYSSPVSRQTNPLLAFSRIGSTAWYASER